MNYTSFLKKWFKNTFLETFSVFSKTLAKKLEL